MLKAIPALLVLAVVLAICCACSPAPKRTLQEAGFSGNTQLWEETATGCLYSSHTDSFEVVPVTDPNGRHVGCRD